MFTSPLSQSPSCSVSKSGHHPRLLSLSLLIGPPGVNQLLALSPCTCCSNLGISSHCSYSLLAGLPEPLPAPYLITGYPSFKPPAGAGLAVPLTSGHSHLRALASAVPSARSALPSIPGSFSSFWSQTKHRQLQLLFSCSAVSNSLRPHGLKHTRLPCPSLSP